MPSGRTTKRARLAELIETIQLIDENIWVELKRDLAPISDGYLRSMLRDSGRQMIPLVEGVHITDLAEAERTLRALAIEYERAGIEKRKSCRVVVIDAKQRARWRLKRIVGQQECDRPITEEILLWTSTWLDNPSLFPEWVSLRRKLLSIEGRTSQP